MSDLAEFLLARIAKDEAAAREVLSLDARYLDGPAPPDWSYYAHDDGAVWRPSITLGAARAMAECDAKRRIVERCDAYNGDDLVADDVLRLLALPYADHPDYREEWRP